MSLSEIKKTIITALGMIAALGTEPVLHSALNLLPASWATVLSIVFGIATVVLNYLAPNETSDPLRAVGRSVRVKGEKPQKSLPAAA